MKLKTNKRVILYLMILIFMVIILIWWSFNGFDLIQSRRESKEADTEKEEDLSNWWSGVSFCDSLGNTYWLVFVPHKKTSTGEEIGTVQYIKD